jgi:murein peptide amidase A
MSGMGRKPLVATLAAVSAVGFATALFAHGRDGEGSRWSSDTGIGALARGDRDRDAPRPNWGRRTIGRSVQGRPVELLSASDGRLGLDPKDKPDVLVVGCIHGTECDGIEVIRRLRHPRAPAADLDLIPNLNPDGRRLGTRLNARGVDLNRNFAARWEPLQSRGDPQYSGPRPFSEPETRIARHTISTLDPDVTIWFHQHAEAGLVRAWGPSVPAARRYASVAGSPFHELPWLPGTAPNWQNHRFPGTASFVVEFPLAGPSGNEADRHAAAIESLAGIDAGRG